MWKTSLANLRIRVNRSHSLRPATSSRLTIGSTRRSDGACISHIGNISRPRTLFRRCRCTNSCFLLASPDFILRIMFSMPLSICCIRKLEGTHHTPQFPLCWRAEMGKEERCDIAAVTPSRLSAPPGSSELLDHLSPWLHSSPYFFRWEMLTDF